MIRQMDAARRIWALAFRDTWQELWTILVVHVLFLLGLILIIPGPPVMLALFFYGNRIAHGEVATERDFLQAIRRYWGPAWRWGLLNLAVMALLAGDYYLTGKLLGNTSTAHFIQGLYVAFFIVWFLLQIYALPFVFEQKQPSVTQALRNAAVFIRKNLILVSTLTLLVAISLLLGMLAFMLTFVFGGAFVAFASNRAVLQDLPGSIS